MAGQPSAQQRKEKSDTEISYLDLLEESKKIPEHPPRGDDINNEEEAAAGSISAEEDASDGVLGPEILSKIKSLADEFPAASREHFVRAVTREAIKAQEIQPTSRPDLDTAETADAALAKVKGDATLLRQWHVYQRLLTTVVLPPDKQLFETLEEAKAGKNLEATYRRARERQAKIGVELVPENDKYIKRVASAATLTYLKFNSKPASLVA